MSSGTLLAGVSALSVFADFRHRAGFGFVCGTCHVIKQFWGKKGGSWQSWAAVQPWSCFPPCPEVDAHGQPSLLSKMVILSNLVVLDCKCALEANPLCAHSTQVWRCWQDSPEFPAFPGCSWAVVGSEDGTSEQIGKIWYFGFQATS